MSGEYACLLKKRALNAFKWAKRAFEEGDYDIAAREAGYAARLYIESFIYLFLAKRGGGMILEVF